MAERPRRKMYYRLGNQTFEEVGNGIVQVTDSHGRRGLFGWDGKWIEGEIRDANLNMLIHVGGPDIPREYKYRWMEVPVDVEHPTGWPEHYRRSQDSAASP